MSEQSTPGPAPPAMGFRLTFGGTSIIPLLAGYWWLGAVVAGLSIVCGLLDHSFGHEISDKRVFHGYTDNAISWFPLIFLTPLGLGIGLLIHGPVWWGIGACCGVLVPITFEIIVNRMLTYNDPRRAWAGAFASVVVLVAIITTAVML